MTASYMPHIVQICHHFASPLPPAFAGPCNFNTVHQTCKHHTWFSSDAAGSEKTSLFCCNCGTFLQCFNIYNDFENKRTHVSETGGSTKNINMFI